MHHPVESLSIKINAPNGGVLIFNQSPTPGWTAEADGSDNLLPIVYANGIHMAISIPPKTKVLKLRYLLNGTN
jgi:hypothetical protein